MFSAIENSYFLHLYIYGNLNYKIPKEINYNFIFFF
jgi:hypothetical protein